MHPLLKLAALVGPVYFVSMALARIWVHRKGGGTIPRWVHGIAVASALLGIWLAYESQRVGGTEFWRDAIVPIVLPALTYLGFGFYGVRGEPPER